MSIRKNIMGKFGLSEENSYVKYMFFGSEIGIWHFWSADFNVKCIVTMKNALPDKFMTISNGITTNFGIPYSYLYIYLDQKSQASSDHEISENFWSGTSEASENFIFYKFQKIWKQYRFPVNLARFGSDLPKSCYS